MIGLLEVLGAIGLTLPAVLDIVSIIVPLAAFVAIMRFGPQAF